MNLCSTDSTTSEPQWGQLLSIFAKIRPHHSFTTPTFHSKNHSSQDPKYPSSIAKQTLYRTKPLSMVMPKHAHWQSTEVKLQNIAITFHDMPSIKKLGEDNQREERPHAP